MAKKISIKDIFKTKNILSYLEGNVKYYYDAIFGLPVDIKDQILYRLALCKDSCFTKDGCEYCGCDSIKKAFTEKSCNDGKKFPDLMSKEEWNKFKETDEYKRNIIHL